MYAEKTFLRNLVTIDENSDGDVRIHMLGTDGTNDYVITWDAYRAFSWYYNRVVCNTKDIYQDYLAQTMQIRFDIELDHIAEFLGFEDYDDMEEYFEEYDEDVPAFIDYLFINGRCAVCSIDDEKEFMRDLIDTYMVF